MFLLNSRHSLFYDTNMVLFFPKLQSQFAEFLQYHSFIHFSILYQLTCVSFSTVFFLLKGFSREIFFLLCIIAKETPNKQRFYIIKKSSVTFLKA